MKPTSRRRRVKKRTARYPMAKPAIIDSSPRLIIASPRSVLLWWHLKQFPRQNLISSHRPRRLRDSLHLSGHSAFVTRDRVHASGTRRRPEEKREENGKWRQTRRVRRERRRRERDRESHGTIDCRVPWGKSILQGHPVFLLLLLLLFRRATRFLLTSSSPLSTSIRVLNTRRKRKTARRPRHWLGSLYYTSSRHESRLYVQSVLAPPLVLPRTGPLTDLQ